MVLNTPKSFNMVLHAWIPKIVSVNFLWNPQRKQFVDPFGKYVWGVGFEVAVGFVFLDFPVRRRTLHYRTTA